jgi:hypothetical protein
MYVMNFCPHPVCARLIVSIQRAAILTYSWYRILLFTQRQRKLWEYYKFLKIHLAFQYHDEN